MIEKSSTTIVVGGVPGTGKTSLCFELAKEFNVGIVLNGDYLREFARAMLAQDPQATRILQTSVYDSWKLFGDKNPDNTLRGYLAQGAVINNGVNAMVERAENNGENLILETLYFIPSQFKFLESKRIIKLYLYISDPEIHKKHLLERIEFSHFNSPGERLVRELDAYRTIMDYSLGESKKYGVKTFNNLDYIKMKEEVLRFIHKGLD